MDNAQKLHQDAMDFADQAFFSEKKGDIERAKQLFAEAFSCEAKAAELLILDYDAEPTRSILCRSAATLAKRSGQYLESERFAAAGLSGFPPKEIAEELRELLEEVNFFRHMSLNGLVLEPQEFQFAISGNEVSKGIANSDEVNSRLKNVSVLLYRTFERILQQPYRSSGKSIFQENYPLYYEAVRGNSFALTIRIASPEDQQQALPLDDIKVNPAEATIDEFITCFQYLENGQKEELEQHIQNPAYFNNFISLAGTIAPDGESIKSVHFTSLRNEKEWGVTLTKSKKQVAEVPIKPIEHPEEAEADYQNQTIRGELKYADATQGQEKNQIKILTSKRQYPVHVPDGMDDIVRELWSKQVIAKVNISNDQYFLTSIEEDE